jgi:hypothetical protein
VTVGYDTVIHNANYTVQHDTITLTLSTPFRTGTTGVIVVMREPGRYTIDIDGESWERIAPDGWLNLELDLEPDPKTITIKRTDEIT